MVRVKGKIRDNKEVFRKIKKRTILRFFPNRLKIKKIDEITITPVMRCNLNCAMCHQREIKHWKDMDYDSFRNVLIKLKKEGVTKISIVGGEIFVAGNMWDYIDLMEKMKFKYDLSSNLFVLPKIDDLKKLHGLEMVTTSLDGTEKIHDKIRGVKGAYKRTTNNIKELLKRGIFVDVATVVQKANFKNLEKIIEGICKLGVKKITLLIENSATEEEKEKTKNTIKKITGQDSEVIISSLKNPFGKLTKKEYDELPKKMKNIEEIGKKYNIKIGASTQFHNPKVLNKKIRLRDYTCSLFNGYGLTVYNDSSLHQCCFIKILDNKNLKNTNPLKIVNSKEQLSLRKAFKKHGAMEICRLCCALKKK